MNIHSVGIDISKSYSTVAVWSSLTECETKTFTVRHTAAELDELAKRLGGLSGDVRCTMEYTGEYYKPIALTLHGAGLWVSVVNPILINKYGDNSIRNPHSDNHDPNKIARYAISEWSRLLRYDPIEETRADLKRFNSQLALLQKAEVGFQNSLTALLDQSFPGVKPLFTSQERDDGSIKWLDFSREFWHCNCVTSLTFTKFDVKYRKWAAKHGYLATGSRKIYDHACAQFPTMPSSENNRALLEIACNQLVAASAGVKAVQREMNRIARQLPEYQTVMSMFGVGKVLGPQLMAEIGDVRRFAKKTQLCRFAGLAPEPNQSGAFKGQDKISKKGSPKLRHTLFVVMMVTLCNKPADNSVFALLDRLRAKGKHYYLYMAAGANKFLRIYYAKVMEALRAAESSPSIDLPASDPMAELQAA
jgi:transposase